MDYDNSLVVTITVTCDLWAPSTGDHLFTCGAIFRPPHYTRSIESESSDWDNFVRYFLIVWLFSYVVSEHWTMTVSCAGWNIFSAAAPQPQNLNQREFEKSCPRRSSTRRLLPRTQPRTRPPTRSRTRPHDPTGHTPRVVSGFWGV